MRRFVTFALLAALALGTATTSADAARAIRGTAVSGNGAAPVICAVDCIPTGQSVRTHPSRDCAAPRPGIAAALVSPREACGSARTSVQQCSDQLASLRRVTVAQVNRVGGRDKVHLVPICDNLHRSLTEQQAVIVRRGNMAGLLRPVARNEILAAALKQGGYRADEVLGIALAPHMAILYVSHLQ